MKNQVVPILFILTFFFSCSQPSNVEKEVDVKDIKTIVTYTPLSHPSLESEIYGFKEGLKNKGFIDGKNILFEDKVGSGDVNKELELIYQSSPELVFLVSTSAAEACVKYCKEYAIPTVFGAVTDASNIVESYSGSSYPITGVTDRYPTKKQSMFFYSFVSDPANSKALILYTPGETNSQILSTETSDYLKEMGLENTKVPIEDINALARKLEYIIQDFDVVIVNGDNAIIEKINVVSSICRENKKPLFVGDPLSVKYGALASLGPDYFGMGLDAGAKAGRILEGEFAGSIECSDPKNFTKVINVEIAKEIGYQILPEIWLSSSMWQTM